MLRNLLLYISLFSILLLSSCNPKCDTSLGVAAQLSITEAVAGMEIMIRTQPADLLRNEIIYALEPNTGAEVRVQKRFVRDQGVIVKMPDNMTGDVELLVEDPDCGGLIPIANLGSRSADYFVDNPNFVTPILPEIVVPSLPNIDPIDITNAWISPQDRSYCLWFGDFQKHFLSHPDGSPIDENPDTPEIDTTFFDSKFLDEKSFEFAIGACTENQDNSLFHNNPVSGVVDFENNYIQIFIDRTGNPRVGAVEEYIGSFVDPTEVLNPAFMVGGACLENQSMNQRQNLMVLNSQLTGHQLMLFKAVQEGD
ncbi:MAG: hypothetical protein R8P61_13490 [Bacteroidia bacterium]|nr:hypothetical protein [Bacteroidia bacterium]